jgi:hypothetical protein
MLSATRAGGPRKRRRAPRAVITHARNTPRNARARHATPRHPRYGTLSQSTHRLGDIDDRDLVLLAGLGVLLAGLLGDERPHAVQVDRGAVVLVLGVVEVPHADLAEVARVVLVHQNAVVVLATGITAATRMLPVLADAAVTHGHVASLLPRLLESGSLREHQRLRAGHRDRDTQERSPKAASPQPHALRPANDRARSVRTPQHRRTRAGYSRSPCVSGLCRRRAHRTREARARRARATRCAAHHVDAGTRSLVAQLRLALVAGVSRALGGAGFDPKGLRHYKMAELGLEGKIEVLEADALGSLRNDSRSRVLLVRV